jgi:predicted nucleic acid-binding protein
MILVDTSVWIDHLRKGDKRLVALLDTGAVLMHPFVTGEIACGNLARRATVLQLLQQLPAAVVADASEVLEFMEARSLHGQGLGWVDVHLLASVFLTPGTRLWTRDKRLQEAAARLHCAYAAPAAKT